MEKGVSVPIYMIVKSVHQTILMLERGLRTLYCYLFPLCSLMIVRNIGSSEMDLGTPGSLFGQGSGESET